MSTPTLAEKIKALKTGEAPIETLKKDEKSKPTKKGGKRAGSGRKTKETTLIERGIQQWVDDHVNEQVEVKIRMPDGTVKTVKKPRVAVVLQRLYEAGTKEDGSVDALKAWLDRALGKPFQPVGGQEGKPFVLQVDF